MTRTLFLCFCLVLPALCRAQSSITQNSPIKNFKLWAFNKEGDRNGVFRGSEAISISPTDLSVKELNFTSFLGGDTTKIDAIVLAPSAIISQVGGMAKVRGDETVRVIRPNELEVTGRQWSYENGRIIILKDAHITIQGQMKDLIK